MFYFLQLRWNGLFIFLLEFLIFYNLYQLIKQIHLVYLIGYKFVLIFYIGWLLVYVDLDIFAFILWMVYGSFLIVIFIMSFNWVETTRYVFLEWTIYYWTYLFMFLVLLILVCSQIEMSNEIFYITMWQFNWINYYEVLIIDLEEELEILGWGLGFDNLLILCLISVILTMVCVCMVYIISSAKKSKFINYIIIYRSYLKQKCIHQFINLRVQSLYIQNYKRGYKIQRHFKMFHNRRI